MGRSLRYMGNSYRCRRPAGRRRLDSRDRLAVTVTAYIKAFNMRGGKVWSFISPLWSNYNLVDAYVTG